MRSQVERMDSLNNLVSCRTGLGREDSDARTLTTRPWVGQPDPYLLELEYQSSWMAYREVHQLSNDMFRSGFDLRNVEPPDTDVTGIQAILEGDRAVNEDGHLGDDRGLLYYAEKVTEIGNAIGGAALLAIVDDGLDPIEPLNVNRIQRVVGWVVLDRREIMPWYGRGDVEPQYYMLTSVTWLPPGSEIRTGQVIHKSRLWVNVGRELSRTEMRARQGWGASWLEMNWAWRRGAEEALSYLLTYAWRASWLNLSIANLDEMLKSVDEEGTEIGPELVDRRAQLFRQQATTLGIGITDAGSGGQVLVSGTKIEGRPADKVESIGESVGDLPKIEETARNVWRMGTAIPASIAFGEGVSGLRGGDNDGDWMTWEGQVQGAQSTDGNFIVNWMLTLMFAAKDGPTGGMIPRWTLEPKPLRAPTADEKIGEQNSLAEGDARRILDRVVTSAEVRKQRVELQDFGPLRIMEGIDTTEAETPLRVGDLTVLFDTAKAIKAGEMTAEAGAQLIVLAAGDRYTPEQARAFAVASLPQAPAAPTTGATGASSTSPAVPAGPGEQDEVDTDADVVAFTLDPLPPGGVKTAKQIVTELAGQIPITVRTIRKLARPGSDGSPPLIRVWDTFGREPGYSIAEVVADWNRRNAAPTLEPAEIQPNQ